MDFRILGPLEVAEDGDPIALGGPRQRALLSLLLLRANETVSRDWLIDELWEEQPPRSGVTALHNHVARLRRTLGPERVFTRPDGYTIRIEPGELDLDRFRALFEASGDRPRRDRADRLRQALTLWRGAPLSGPPLGPFARAEVARLEELHLAALEELVDAELELGRHAEVVSELTALVAAHPLSERLRGQLILALYRCGRQAEALDVYRETRRLLDDELGLEPSPALRELERAILRHDPELAPAKRLPQPGSPGGRARPAPRLVFVAAGAALLAAAGGTAAWLLTGGGTPEPAVALQTSSAAEVGTTEPPPIAVTTTPPVVRPVVRRRPAATTATVVERKPPRSEPEQQRPVSRAAVTTPTTETRPTTTAKRPAQPKIAQPKPFTISDDFSRSSMDPLIWYPIGKENGAIFAHRDGRLEITIAPDAQPNEQWNQVGGHYGTHCRFTGDFDARVDFELLTWPTGSGVYAGLNAYFADAAVVRQSSAKWGDQYGSWVIPAATGVPLADLTGRLRMKRVDGVITTYFWYGGGWRRLVSGVSRGTAVLGLQAQANGDEFTRAEVRVAYDNFVVKATEADCPSWADPRAR